MNTEENIKSHLEREDENMRYPDRAFYLSDKRTVGEKDCSSEGTEELRKCLHDILGWYRQMKRK